MLVSPLSVFEIPLVQMRANMPALYLLLVIPRLTDSEYAGFIDHARCYDYNLFYIRCCDIVNAALVYLYCTKME